MKDDGVNYQRAWTTSDVEGMSQTSAVAKANSGRSLFRIDSEGKMAINEGPFVQAACFCDQVIEDKTGALSLIRVVDVINHSEAGTNPPDQMPPFPYQLKLVLMLKSGKAEGRSQIKLVPELPTGETETSPVWTVHFEGEDKGTNLVVNFAYVFKFEGLYWFKVLVDDQMLTRIPLRVRYSPVTVPAQGGPLAQ